MPEPCPLIFLHHNHDRDKIITFHQALLRQSETTGWGRISEIMLEPISETIYAVDTISQLPMAC